jgi:Uncharacterized membrane protein, required for N-linked glycosylation
MEKSYSPKTHLASQNIIQKHEKKSKKTTFILLAITLLIVFIPIFFTPLHSDDFIYVLHNDQWSNLVWRYFNWSGRIVADSFSLVALQLPKVLASLIQALIWTGLIFFITTLPSVVNKNFKFNKFHFIVIFLLYWVANPNLGQTSFWTVGFANYIFTNFLIIVYFSFLFYLRDREMNSLSILALVVLAILAGNSNENTSIVLVLLTMVMLVIEKNKKVFLVALPSTILGALILLLSPGQRVRLEAPSFQVMREQSIFERIWNYFSSSLFIETFKSFMWLFAIFILLSFIYLIQRKVLQKRNIVYSIIFFFAAILSNAAFGGSYLFPVAPRSLNGALILFLVSLAFYIDDLKLDKKILWKSGETYLILLLLIPFSLGYYYATKSVYSLSQQFKIRENIIFEANKNNPKAIYIPNYYVGKLYNPSDSIDMFQGMVGEYVGVSRTTNIKKFNKDFSFDYSNKRLVNKRQFPLNRDFGNNIHLRAINILPDTRTLKKNSINMVFDNDLKKKYDSSRYKVFIHVVWKRQGNSSKQIFNADTSLNNQLAIDGKYIFSSPIGDIRLKDILSIKTGIYDTQRHKNLNESVININDK